MYWQTEKSSFTTRKGAPPDSVAMPDAAIDLRSIVRAELDGTELVLTSRSEREFRLKPCSLADEVHMKDWQLAVKIRVDESESGVFQVRTSPSHSPYRVGVTGFKLFRTRRWYSSMRMTSQAANRRSRDPCRAFTFRTILPLRTRQPQTTVML